MAISRIKTDGIQDEAVTSAKIGDNIDLDGQFVRVPHGTTAERPGSPAAGYLRFNTTIGTLEQWNTNTNAWAAVDSPPIITSVAYTGSATAADPAGGETITVNGSNFKSGFSLTVGGTTAPTTTFVSSTQITFTTPAKTAGDYDIVVTNSNGLAATSTNGISYNGLPAFTTAAGNVGSVLGGDAMATITIVAAEPDGGTLAYSITSGALPTGTTLGSANGQITGTPTAPVSTTTFNFTVTATDDESQTNARAFNLIVLRPIYSTQLANSLRFNDDDSAYLQRTPSSDSNRKTLTWSGWVKRSKLGAFQNLFTAEGDGGGESAAIRFDSSDRLDVIFLTDGSDSVTGRLITNAKFRDVSAWLHIVYAQDTTSSTAGNRMRLYVNGSEITSFATDTNPTQNHDGQFNAAVIHRLGAESHAGNQELDGYLSDVYLIDGQALTPTSFAEEYYGVWAPKAYSGSYGTNGFKLDFANSADIGNDVSGNNNDYTPTNFGTFDVFPDSPTINFCTLNPLMKRRDVSNNVTFYQGNLGAVYPNAGGNQTYSFGTHSMSSGKWYYEVYMFTTGSNTTVGIGSQGDADAVDGHIVYYRHDGTVGTSSLAGGTSSGNGASYANGDVVGCAFDLDNGTVKFYKNGALQSTVTGISTTTTYMPYVRGTTSEQILTNFGQDSTFSGTVSAASNADANGIGNFKYTVPSDHLAICSKNFAESTINTSLDDRPEDYFNSVIYNGTSAVQSITVGFQPDFTWLKRRDGAGAPTIYDSVRGTPKRIFTDATTAESSAGDGFTDFNSTGFDLTGTPSGGDVNTSSRTYVGWSWKAGGAPTADNTAGVGAVPTAGSVKIDGANKTDALAGTLAAKKITANTKSGFSIVKYTGEGNGAKTIAHGLNSAPEMIWIKNLTDAENWCVYSSEIAATQHLRLNVTSAPSTPTNQRFNSTRPTNTVFSIGATTTDNEVGSNGDEYIAYCWHSVPGFSRIGFYQSSGFADGVFVELGFKPAWILIKSSSAGRNWTIWDNVRGHASSVGAGNNPNTTTLFANEPNAETHNAGYAVDFTANGFKTRGQGGEINTTNEKMIFMAFAEDPFKYSEAR